jgi:hypothetical protein
MINLDDTKRGLLMEAGRFLFYSAISIGSCFSIKGGCEYNENKYDNYREESKRIEVVDINGYQVICVEPDGYFIAISDKNELEIRKTKNIKEPFKIIEVTSLGADKSLRSLEKVLEVKGETVSVEDSIGREVTSFRVRK